MCTDIDDQEIEVWKLVALSLLNHHIGDDQAAKEYIRRALDIMSVRYILGWKMLLSLGNSLTALGGLAEAEAVYHQVVALGDETKRPRQAIEALAGLARVSMIRGDTEQALDRIEKILTYLETETPSTGHPLDGTIEPVRIYLTCYQVLRANKDHRAHGVLVDAYNFLHKRAANIANEDLRHSFLYNVAANREVVNEIEKSGLLDQVGI